MNIVIEISNNRNLSIDEVIEEILLAENKMNAGSKIRFHVKQIFNQIMNNKVSRSIPKSDLKYFKNKKR